MLLSARGDPIKATLAARRAAELAPSAPYWALVAEACERAGRVDDAVSAARRAAELEPDNASWERLVERLTKH
jgi:Flp pilus assembly protein TadD